MTQPIATSEILYGAADHIQKYGHHKGDGFATTAAFTSPACAIGGITVAARGVSLTDRSEVIHAAQTALHRYLGAGVGIVYWNDAPERTADEVIATLRAAAVIEAAKEQADPAATWSPPVALSPETSGVSR